jgi:hypothetical protein
MATCTAGRLQPGEPSPVDVTIFDMTLILQTNIMYYKLTQDTEVLPLLRDGTIWTLGADSMDVDHERLWRNYLAHDSYKAKGAL